jgi:hypothetical protein
MVTKNQNGQSTIEFILTFALGLSLIFFVISSSINYATGYLVHYATFMASRVYLTDDNHLNNSQGTDELAKEAFKKYNLGIFKIDPDKFKVNLVQDVNQDRNKNLTVGAYTTFELNMDLIGQIAGKKKMELVSESFLGKEPTRAECAKRVCYAISRKEDCDGMDITLYDDGC